MFLRRGGEEGRGFLEVRLALFWLAAALWLVGVALNWSFLTPVAIGVLLLALVLGLIARRR
jgi:hypothetical protein